MEEEVKVEFDLEDMPPPPPIFNKHNYALADKLIYYKDRPKSYKIFLPSEQEYVYVVPGDLYAEYILEANNNLEIITDVPFIFKGQTFKECNEPEPDLRIPIRYKIVRRNGPPQPIFRSKKSTDTKKSKGKKVPKKSKRKKVTKKSN